MKNPNTDFKNCSILLQFLILFCGFLSFSQNNDSIINKLVDRQQTLSGRQASEQIYIQTSKTIYETSEDLWFKGYVLNSQYLTPSSQSKTLYVQLIEDATKKAVWEEKYEIENGFVDGHLYVQDSLQNGSYTLVGYTSHSFYNNKQAIQSIRKLQIVNNITDYYNLKKQDTILTNESKENSIDFQLFPESGHLVTGIQSKLAFKAVDAEGNPKTVSGTLYENNTPKVTFATSHAGMGSFIFTPNIKKNYYLKLDSITTKQYPLPTIQPKGYVLQLVGRTKEAIRFKVWKNTKKKKEILHLRVQVRGVVYSVAKAEVNQERTIKIPLKDLPCGIAEVTLFNQNLEPVAERLVYVNQDQKLNIKAILDKGEYPVRGKAQLKLKVTDQNNTPVVAHLGVSIFDNFYNNPKDTKTILTHYNLSTQLKGRLYNPSYYFNKENKSRKADLDVLLLTQGWRAYKWNKNNLKAEPLKKKPYINDTIVGKLYAKHPKYKPLLPQQYLVAFTADDTKGKVFIEVDSLGRYIILPEYMGLASRGYLYIKLLGGDEINKKINNTAIDDPSFGAISQLQKQKVFNYPIFKKVRVQQLYDKRPFTLTDDVNKLEEIIIKGKKKKRVFRDKYMGKLDSLAKLETGDYVCKLNFLNCTSCGYGTQPKEGGNYMIWLGDGVHHHGQGLRYFKGSEIKNIEYHYRVLTESELLRKFNLATIKGYYGKKEFYSPVYDKAEQQEDFPDYRNTLFWKPDIITNEKGEATIEFFCSDINTKFLGIIEGVSGDGLLGSETLEFIVRKKE